MHRSFTLPPPPHHRLLQPPPSHLFQRASKRRLCLRRDWVSIPLLRKVTFRATMSGVAHARLTAVALQLYDPTPRPRPPSFISTSPQTIPLPELLMTEPARALPILDPQFLLMIRMMRPILFSTLPLQHLSSLVTAFHGLLPFHSFCSPGWSLFPSSACLRFSSTQTVSRPSSRLIRLSRWLWSSWPLHPQLLT